jgi:hypothetical protein
MEPLILFFIFILICCAMRDHHDRKVERNNRRTLVLSSVAIVSLIVRRDRERRDVLGIGKRQAGPESVRYPWASTTGRS